MANDVFTAAERIAHSLKRHDVTHIFAQSLPSAVILAAEAIGIRQVAYRQENMGGTMADGYARLSGKIGVVAAQNGPAATLLVPPLAEALKASVPIVALVQDVERDQADRNAFQELDHLALFQSCTKWVRKVIVADRIDDYVDAAFTAAASGRPGPVALLLPADLLREQIAPSAFRREAALGHWPLDRLRPRDSDIERAASMIAEAHAPVIIAGGGVHASRAAGELSALQDEASLPVVTTNMGKGAVDEFHPLSAGVLGALVGPKSLGRHTVALVEEADLVILVGTRTNQNGTDSWRQIPLSASVIHVDVDPVEIGRTYEAVRLAGDAAEIIGALRRALAGRDLSYRASKRNDVASRIAGFWHAFDMERQSVAQSDASPIRPERIMFELQRMLTADTTIVADASYSSMWVAGQLRALSPGMRFISPRGLAGLGWGVPLALGAKAARPDKPVVAIVGDGGFAHSWAELETMVRSKLPVLIIVLNNGVLGFQRDAETVKFGSFTTACKFADVDHQKIAEACGCPAVRIFDPADLPRYLERGLAGPGPLLIEVMTEPGAHPPLSLFAAMDEAA
ncbi:MULTISPECIES: acetolactate synthase catalytic subunit [Rhizobium]|uniref:acetolactate synthase catalytic subunit n=1 Tax=Rhizobium TaxID=379 RepID=UPI0007E9486A|nr:MULTISPECIES: acetolactate synthase catalytic subunit [Rhizobium]ANK95509.1 acetolactate synthase catalytic subunit protein [Rhizobium sp. N6212]ANL01561.1 acetolactate synthase catalytic subunit protein [Rhizobium sp. N621]ANL07689.1 acetolactate synthase catalytic subunit protein [Rhizobium esperanzae]ANL13860.1 acetolactate synthase catalytic subunit protein [Rhizobium sp. N1341]ANL25843.1 acetolactate synthase catalytic subunit protein [Rhizobium sp. N113]